MSSSHINDAIYRDLQRRKVLDELENLASKIIERHGSHERREDDFRAALHMWRIRRHLEYSKVCELDTEEASHLFRDEHHVGYMISLLENLTTSINELHRDLKSQLKPISSKLSRGLCSIPDDLLSLIFEFANPPGEGTRQAIWLSHVSRRFRRVAFSACRLWTTLHSNASRDELEALIARSGTKSELSIVISRPFAGGLDIHSFMDICVPLASRWTILTIQSRSDETENRNEPETADETMQAILGVHELVLPCLQELRIAQRRYDVDSGRDSWVTENFNLSWLTPNLHTIHCDEYIPFYSPAYSALRSFSTSFSLSTEHYPERFEDLHTFLDAGKAITNLSLTIRTLVNIMQPLQLTEICCNSLTSLSLRLSQFIFPKGKDYLVHPLMRSLVMPNLTTFSVCVELRYDDILDDPEGSDALYFLVRALLPDYKTHTNLSTFNIELTHTTETKAWGEIHTRHKLLLIPLERIPYVSKLSVKTFCELTFDNDTTGGTALRELQLQDCENYEVESLKDTIVSLKRSNTWEALEKFKVEEVFSDCDYEEVLKEVGAERLSFIPIDRIKFYSS